MSSPFFNQGYFPHDDDYYLILDVDANASQETITSAYRNLARRFHPDKNNNDERSRKEAEVIFQKIKTAYDVLKDPRKRAIYDNLGPDGLKLDWKLVPKRLTGRELREEFLRLQKLNLEKKLALTAKPRSSFTLALNASQLFSRSPPSLDGEDDELVIEISSMLASMSVEHCVAPSHSVTLSGNVGSKGGTGDGSLATKYRYSYSDRTQADLYFEFGRGPMVKLAVRHEINDKTSVSCSGFLVSGPYSIIPGSKITLTHKIRKNLVGRVTYMENVDNSVTTSLIYLNEKLMLRVTTSYKLDRIHHTVGLNFDYNFNSNRSKLSVSLGASTKDGLVVAYGCETTIFEINVVGASISLGLESGVTLKLHYNRANQEFIVPIYLSDELHSEVLFYGTLAPLISYYLLDRCYLRNYKRLD